MATDVELLTALGDVLTALLPEGWQALQNYQPTGQARHEATTVYFAKMGDRAVGYPERVEVWNPATGAFDQGHSQVFISTFRVQGYTNRDAPDSILTPADVTACASLALQTDYARGRFREVEAQPMRIMQLPSVMVQDERDRWEEVATFDFPVSHTRVMVIQTPAATLGPVSIYSV